MNNHLRFFVSFLCLLGSAGFLHGAPSGANQPTSAQLKTLPPAKPCAVTGREANSRVWERTVYELDPSGAIGLGFFLLLTTFLGTLRLSHKTPSLIVSCLKESLVISRRRIVGPALISEQSVVSLIFLNLGCSTQSGAMPLEI